MSQADAKVFSHDNILTDLISEDEEVGSSNFISKGGVASYERDRYDEKARDSDDTDLEMEMQAMEKTKSSKFDATGKQMYVGACKMYNQVPVSYFLKESHKEALRMRHHSLGVIGTKALCVSLLSNTTLESLDLDDNGVENQGCIYIADMLRENYFITDLTLSNNSIGDRGALAIFSVIKQSDSLARLNMAGNQIGDRASASIFDAMAVNTKLVELNLCCNKFGDLSGEYFGKMLEYNCNLKRLDLSFNSFRMKSMQSLLMGGKKNAALLYLNLANNGIGHECAAEVGRMLKENKTLEELNISNCRIPLAGVLPIARVFKFNNTLKYLDMSRNTFMAPGCLVMVESLTKTKANWGLRLLSFGSTLVTQQFAGIQTALERDQNLLIIHGGIMEDWKRSGNQITPANTRQALCFLTDEECKQLAGALSEHVPEKKGRASLKDIHKAMNALEWYNRSKEILRRLIPMIQHGQVEYKSLL